MSDDLKKGLKERLLAAGLAVAMPNTASAPTLDNHYQKIHESHVSNNPDKSEPKDVEMKFDPSTLNQELHPIAHLESSFGKNMHHKANSHGDMDTALGAVGLKPTTAFETYQKSKSLQKLFPNFNDSKVFLGEMKANPQFYNAMASATWNHMKRAVGDVPEKTAYAWRHGLNAAQLADDDTINQDPYVKRYSQLRSGKIASPKKESVSLVQKRELMSQIVELLQKQENNLKIAQAAFRTTDGKVCPCGPIHDLSALPEGSIVEEDGFILKDGSFVNRAEATKLLHLDHQLQSQEVKMEKAMPTPHLPKLGVENRRETPLINNPTEIGTKTRFNG